VIVAKQHLQLFSFQDTGLKVFSGHMMS